jgi:hypothetical protein
MSPFVIVLIITAIILFIFLLNRLKPGKNSDAQNLDGIATKSKWNRGIPGNKKAGANQFDDSARKAFDRQRQMATESFKRANDTFEATRKRNEITRKQIEENTRAVQKRNEMLRKQMDDINRANRNRNLRGF